MSNSYNVSASRVGGEGVLSCCWLPPADLLLLDRHAAIWRVDAASKSCRQLVLDLALQALLDSLHLKPCEVHLRPGHKGLLLLAPQALCILSLTGKRDNTTVSLLAKVSTEITLIAVADFNSTSRYTAPGT